MVGASMAAVLLYVSPVFVAIFSKIVYKEKINKIKNDFQIFVIKYLTWISFDSIFNIA